jgi:hypothetical protein
MTINWVKVFTVSFIVCGLVPCLWWALTGARCGNTSGKIDGESYKKSLVCVVQMDLAGKCVKFLALVAGGYYLWKYPE